MAKGFSNGVGLGQLRTLFDDGAVRGLSDGELLGRFLDDRGDLGEAAFEVLVHRHGPLVFGVCRRALRDPHQTEDAFQATFLVLARKARSIRNREAVGPWLVGVAGKVAARAKGDAQRRRAREGRAAGLVPRWVVADSADRDEIDLLLREVDRLRRPLREAVVLCHLQGLTYESAAESLGVTEGAVRGRLARAREVLRARLARRGFSREISPSVLLAPKLLGTVPERLIGPTIRASTAVAAGRAVTGMVPGSAITLMEGALQTMLFAKLKTTAVLALGVGLITLGSTFRVHALQKPEASKAVEAGKVVEVKGDAADLAELLGGRIVRSAEVTKDCMILSYLPDWAFGNVDNIAIAGNDGGVRTLVDWPDVPSAEAKSADLRFYLAFYSRKTTAKPKPGSVVAFEVTGEWPERTSWKTRPPYEPEPTAYAKFEPGEGWKALDITNFVRTHNGKSGKGLLIRFLIEDRPADGDWSGYEFVSREGKDEWAKRRPMLVVVGPTKK
jgi:RNA polymerase sigma factor (sigma-70 family)